MTDLTEEERIAKAKAYLDAEEKRKKKKKKSKKKSKKKNKPLFSGSGSDAVRSLGKRLGLTK